MSFSAQYPPVLTESGDMTSEVLAKYNQEFQYLYTTLLSQLFSATTGHAHTGSGSDGAQLGASSIADDAITTLKILNEAVTAAKLATDAVTADKILADAVTTVKILNGAITTAKFAEDAKCPLAGTADLATNATNATNATTAGKVANALTVNGTAYDGSEAQALTTVSVSVTTGTIADGGAIPLPDGYTREQCSYSVWPHNFAFPTNPMKGITCQVTQSTGVVVAKITDTSDNTTSETAGYMCVGVK